MFDTTTAMGHRYRGVIGNVAAMLVCAAAMAAAAMALFAEEIATNAPLELARRVAWFVLIAAAAMFLAAVTLLAGSLRRLREQDREHARWWALNDDILRAIPHGFFLVDADFRVRDPVSPALSQLLKCMLWPGMDLLEALRPALPAKTLAAVRIHMRELFGPGGREYQLTARNPLAEVTPGGYLSQHIQLEFRFERVERDGAAACLLVIISDISERARVSRELSGVQLRLRAQIDALTRVLAHDRGRVDACLDRNEVIVERMRKRSRQFPPTDEVLQRKTLFYGLLEDARTIKHDAAQIDLELVETPAHWLELDLLELSEHDRLNHDDGQRLVAHVEHLRERIGTMRGLMAQIDRRARAGGSVAMKASAWPGSVDSSMISGADWFSVTAETSSQVAYGAPAEALSATREEKKPEPADETKSNGIESHRADTAPAGGPECAAAFAARIRTHPLRRMDRLSSPPPPPPPPPPLLLNFSPLPLYALTVAPPLVRIRTSMPISPMTARPAAASSSTIAADAIHSPSPLGMRTRATANESIRESANGMLAEPCAAVDGIGLGKDCPPPSLISQPYAQVGPSAGARDLFASEPASLPPSDTNDTHAALPPAKAALVEWAAQARRLAGPQGKVVRVEAVLDLLELLPMASIAALREIGAELVGNAVTHGIESISARMRAGKKLVGVVRLNLSCDEQGGWQFDVHDDGSGIDLTQLRTALPCTGRYTADEVSGMSDRDLAVKIFESGVTTAIGDGSTSLGLGLPRVMERVNAIGAHMWVATSSGKYTEFRMRWLIP